MTNRFEALRYVDNLQSLAINHKEQFVVVHPEEGKVKRQKIEDGTSQHVTMKTVVEIGEKYFNELESFLAGVESELPLEKEIIQQMGQSPCKALFQLHLMKQASRDKNLFGHLSEPEKGKVVETLYPYYLYFPWDDFEVLAELISKNGMPSDILRYWDGVKEHVYLLRRNKVDADSIVKLIKNMEGSNRLDIIKLISKWEEDNDFPLIVENINLLCHLGCRGISEMSKEELLRIKTFYPLIKDPNWLPMILFSILQLDPQELQEFVSAIPKEHQVFYISVLPCFPKEQWGEVKTILSTVLKKDLYAGGLKGNLALALMMNREFQTEDNLSHLKANVKKIVARYQLLSSIVDKVPISEKTLAAIIGGLPLNQLPFAIQLLGRMYEKFADKDFDFGFAIDLAMIGIKVPVFIEFLRLSEPMFDEIKKVGIDKWIQFTEPNMELFNRLGKKGYFDKVPLDDIIVMMSVPIDSLNEASIDEAMKLKKRYPKMEWAILGLQSIAKVKEVGDWIYRMDQLKNSTTLHRVFTKMGEFQLHNPELDLTEVIDIMSEGSIALERLEKRFPSLPLKEDPVLLNHLKNLILDVKRFTIPLEKIFQGATDREREVLIGYIKNKYVNDIFFWDLIQGIPEELCREVIISVHNLLENKTNDQRYKILVHISEIIPPLQRLRVIRTLSVFKTCLEEVDTETVDRVERGVKAFEALEERGYFQNLDLKEQYFLLLQLDGEMSDEQIEKAVALKNQYPNMEWVTLKSVLEGVELKETELTLLQSKKNSITSHLSSIFGFLRLDRGAELDELIDLCIGGEACKERIEKRFPSLFKEDEIAKVRDLIILNKNLKIPFQAILRGLEESQRNEVMNGDISLTAVLFGALIKGVPEERCQELVLGVKDHLSLVRRFATIMPPSKRVEVVRRFTFFKESTNPPSNELLDHLEKSVEPFGALDRSGYFQGVEVFDQYFILQNLSKSISQDNVKRAMEVKTLFPKLEWAALPLVLLGVEAESCAYFLNGIAQDFDNYKVVIFLMTYLFKDHSTSMDEKIALFNEEYATLDSRMKDVSRACKDDEDFIEALFDEKVKTVKTPLIDEGIEVDAPFEFLPKKIVLSPDHGIFTSEDLEDKKGAIKVLGFDRFPTLKFFKPFFKMEMEDYFLLLYKRVPISKEVKSSTPTESPAGFRLDQALESIHKTLYGEAVLKNNQRVIGSICARKDIDNQWNNFSVEIFEQMEKLAEWVYLSIASPESDPENTSAVLNAISDSVENHCPSDWLNEFIFQYSLIHGSNNGVDIIQSYAANSRLKVVSAMMEVIARLLVASGTMSSFKNAIMWISDNHRRNRLLVWLQPRFIPGSHSISSKTDPYLPNDLGRILSQASILNIFDYLYTLKFQLSDLLDSLNSPLFNQHEILWRLLETSPLAISHESEYWQEAKDELLQKGPPKIELQLTDLSTFFTKNMTPIKSPEDIKTGADLKLIVIKQFLISHQTDRLFKEQIEAWLKDPTSEATRSSLEKAYSDYEKSLEPERKRNQLKMKMLPCTLQDEDIESYFANKLSFEELVNRGIASGQKDSFAKAMMTEEGKFKREACLILMVLAGLYRSRNEVKVT